MSRKTKANPPKQLSKTISIAGIVAFLIICATITVIAWPYMKGFINTPDAFPAFVQQNGLISILVYVALQVLQVVVAIIPGEFLEIAAGVAFGWFWGLLIAELGIALGTLIIFAVFRKLGKPLIHSMLGENKLAKLDRLNAHPKRDAIVFLIFLIPGLPKDLLTYAAAFFDMTVWRFLLLTLIARIPSIITSTIAGKSIIQKDYRTAIIIFLITSAIAILGFLFSEKIMLFIQEKRQRISR